MMTRMKVFIATSYSSQVNHETGEVFPEYKEWLENILCEIEAAGHAVFCALRADGYRINADDPVDAFRLDMRHIRDSTAVLALLGENVSVGVQTEIGVGIALEMPVILAHDPRQELAYFNGAMLKAGVVSELLLPLDRQKLDAVLR